MGLSCGAQCTKFILVVFNFFFWISGIALLGVGIWVLVDKDIIDVTTLVQDKNDPYLDIVAYILIGVGAFVFFVGFFGCCGALRESKCLLGMYILLMALVLCGELAGGILAAVFKGELETAMTDELKKKIKVDYMDGNVIGLAWNAIQYRLKCCGAASPLDYKNSSWYNKQRENNQTDPRSVPLYCCKPNDGVKSFKDFATDSKVCEKEARTFFENPDLGSDYKRLNVLSCKTQVENLFNDKMILLIALGCGIAGVELIGFVLAICLCRAIEPED